MSNTVLHVAGTVLNSLYYGAVASRSLIFFYFPPHPQVLSGCAIIVRGQPRGGPPPERQINLSNIRAGNLARRAAVAQPDAKDTPDEVGSS